MDSALSPTTVQSDGTGRPKIAYLDQNMWIDLARAADAPQDHPQDRQILELLCAMVEAGAVRLPLTVTNIYETHKVNDPQLRALIAYTQATLSRGEVFRGHRRRLEVEIGRVLSAIYGLDWTEPDPDWVFSRLFFEAFAELGTHAPGSNSPTRCSPCFRAIRRAPCSTSWPRATSRYAAAGSRGSNRDARTCARGSRRAGPNTRARASPCGAGSTASFW